MAFLNRQEREALRSELLAKGYNGAKWKLRGMDDKVRLVYYRNAQTPTLIHTRYVLPTLGANVTLVEEYQRQGDILHSLFSKQKAGYKLVDVVVEPTADNRT